MAGQRKRDNEQSNTFFKQLAHHALTTVMYVDESGVDGTEDTGHRAERFYTEKPGHRGL